MKNMKNFLELSPSTEVKIIHTIMTRNGTVPLEKSMRSTEIVCKFCGGDKGYTCKDNPEESNKNCWICANFRCEVTTGAEWWKEKYLKLETRVRLQKGVCWAVFCEINSIGDVYHDLKFDDIEFKDEIKQILKKHITSCQGIVIFHGVIGKGKTYTALCMLQLFTTENSSAIFIKQKRLFDEWLEFTRNGNFSLFRKKIEGVCFLVIDDVGTKDLTPSFLEFLLDIIDFRMQWKRKLTVITTNVLNENFSETFGDRLADRLSTAFCLKFSGESRR
jgi:DNA replication protein DnaC